MDKKHTNPSVHWKRRTQFKPYKDRAGSSIKTMKIINQSTCEFILNSELS